MTQQQFDISEQNRNYETLGLTDNPFPYSPVPDEEPAVYCGQEHVVDAVSETISTVLNTSKSKHLVITGKYGNGKSHTLKYARTLLRDRPHAFVGYVAQPGEGFLDIYHEFMYDVGFDRVQDLAYEYLAKVARDTTEHNPMGAEDIRGLVADGDVLLSDLVPQTIQRLSDITKFADFARALVHLVYEDTNLYAWQWLTAEGIRYEQRKEMEIHTALDDDTMGVRAFTAFKNVLRALDYKAVFVFIDEFESVARLSSKEEQSLLNSLRHLIDQNSHGLSLLFGCAPEVWQDVMSEYHAFSERVGREVPLRPLQEEDLRELLQDYLNTARTESQTGLKPFTEDALQSLHHRSQGNVRQVLSLGSRVLDKAVEANHDKIDADLIETIAPQKSTE